MERVTILTIDHRHGSNVYVCRNEDVAEQELLTFVKEWWDEIPGMEDMPSDPWEAINAYFEAHADDEWYSMDSEDVIEPSEVQP